MSFFFAFSQSRYNARLTAKKRTTNSGHHAVTCFANSNDTALTPSVSQIRADRNLLKFSDIDMTYFVGIWATFVFMSHLPVKNAPTSMKSCLV